MTIHKSRWGFHSCSFDEMKKIHSLFKHYMLALHARAAWHRWNNKLPHNRVIKKKIPGGGGYKIISHRPEPFFPSIYNNILKKNIGLLYYEATHPEPEENLVKPLSIPLSKVESLLEEIEGAYQEI